MGHKPNFSKRTFDKSLGHVVRSGWESIVGKMLKILKIEYIYEKGFWLNYPNGEHHRYYPDYIFQDKNAYEVKGRFYKDSEKIKLKLFHLQYPEYRMFLVAQNRIKEEAKLGIHYDQFINYDEVKRFVEVNSGQY